MILDYEFSRPYEGDNDEGLPKGHIALDPQRADVYHAFAGARFMPERAARAAVKAATEGMPREEAQSYQRQAEELLPTVKLT